MTILMDEVKTKMLTTRLMNAFRKSVDGQGKTMTSVLKGELLTLLMPSGTFQVTQGRGGSVGRKLCEFVYVFLRAMQGSCGGPPPLWARAKAMSACCAQSTCSPRNTRIDVCADDPIIISVGHAAMRRKNIAQVLLVRLIRGFAIAWHKTQHCAGVIWASVKFYVSLDKVAVEIKRKPWEHMWRNVCEFP